MNDNEILEPSQGEEEIASSQESCLEAALQYLRQGWPVIPIGLDEKKAWKKALIAWKHFEQQLPSEDEVKSWWIQYPYARVGIVTGRISGLLVVDIDPRHGGFESMRELNLPVTLMTTTGSGGNHLIYRYPNDRLIRNSVNIRPGIDIRGEGGYIVAPPSEHASGNLYEWTMGFDPSLITDCPSWLLEENRAEKAPVTALFSGVGEGFRNDSAARVIGLTLYDIPFMEWETKAWDFISKVWNPRNKPPLDEKELRAVFESIVKLETEKREQGLQSSPEQGDNGEPNRVQLARQFIEYSGIRFFRDNTGRSFIKIKEKDHEELWDCNSLEVERRIEYFFYKQTGKPVPSTLVTSIVGILDAMARFEGERFIPSLRVASGEGGEIYYDPINDSWELIKITTEGWEKVQNPNIHLVRFPHLSEQVEPSHEGDVSALLEFVNISDEKQRLLLLCYVIASFVPEIQHPVLVLTGNKGSAKSTITRMVKRIVDPSPLSELSFPKDSTELSLVLSQNWMPGFDNISTMPAWLSNELCKACSGQAFSKRRLYKDEESVIVAYKRCIILNGINVTIDKSDLLSRSLLLRTEVISRKQRKSERKLEAQFNKQLPLILGGVFNTLSGAMNCLELIPEDDLSRMADFDRWGRAITMALGLSPQLFIEAMQENTDRQTGEAIAQDPVALSVLDFVEYFDEHEPYFEDSATALLRRLEKNASDLKINVHAKEWPKSPAALSMRLNEIESDLVEYGVRMTHTGRLRHIRLEKIPSDASINAKVNADNALNAVSETPHETSPS